MLEKEVAASEPVCRFITGKDYYRPSDKSVRHNAFMPNSEGETSVYRIIDLNHENIYKIGSLFVASIKGKPLKGRADIVVSEILKCRLRVEPQPNPHPRHANIVDWPESESEPRMIALKLAEKAELHLIDSD